MRLHILSTLLFLAASVVLQANNIQVTNVGFEGTPGDDIYEVFFDISWENSWRTSTFESNYDAAWVFAKYKSSSDPVWKHVLFDLAAGPAPSGSELIFPSDNVGAFIQRSSDGIGDVNFANVSLAWQLEVLFDPGDVIEICVYAIEMVFIPEGAFQVGDGRFSLSNGNFQQAGGFDPFFINSENSILLGGTDPSNLGTGFLSSSIPDDFNTSTTQTLPAEYPKGFNAFYIMKYEISQGQYVEFLNTLPTGNTLWPNYYGSEGQSIHQEGTPKIYEADSPERAVNYLRWLKFAYYADWSGLRPMSELEYEKSCRGPQSPVIYEFAWGNRSRTFRTYEFESEGTSGELVLNPSRISGNMFYAVPSSPQLGSKRCGLFAASISNGNRTDVGATYYGVLDMSGNVQERVISLGTPVGRAFNSAIHGDGNIDISTNIDIPTWPTLNYTAQTEGLGTGFRGGSYAMITTGISSRQYINSGDFIDYDDNMEYFSSNGGRLVRSNF